MDQGGHLSLHWLLGTEFLLLGLTVVNVLNRVLNRVKSQCPALSAGFSLSPVQCCCSSLTCIAQHPQYNMHSSNTQLSMFMF